MPRSSLQLLLAEALIKRNMILRSQAPTALKVPTVTAMKSFKIKIPCQAKARKVQHIADEEDPK